MTRAWIIWEKDRTEGMVTTDPRVLSDNIAKRNLDHNLIQRVGDREQQVELIIAIMEDRGLLKDVSSADKRDIWLEVCNVIFDVEMGKRQASQLEYPKILEDV